MEEKNELIKQMKKTKSAGITLLRMDKRYDTLAELNRLEPRFKALIEDVKAFNIMRDIHRKIKINAHEILINEGGATNIIWQHDPNDLSDDINLKIKKALEEVEKVCLPILREQKN